MRTGELISVFFFFSFWSIGLASWGSGGELKVALMVSEQES
jgi:hypothetical protein